MAMQVCFLCKKFFAEFRGIFLDGLFYCDHCYEHYVDTRVKKESK